MIVWWSIGAGVHVEPHSHANEQIVWILHKRGLIRSQRAQVVELSAVAPTNTSIHLARRGTISAAESFSVPCVANRNRPPTFTPQKLPKLREIFEDYPPNLLKSLARPTGLEPVFPP